MTSSYILAAARTPVGKLLGQLADYPAPELAATAITACFQRSGIDAERVQEVILGNVLTAGVGQAPARQAALAAGCPERVAALTINKVCGSGLKAIMLADQAVRLGDAEVVVAGGMESMSRAPFLLQDCRRGWKFGTQAALDSMLHDGLSCAHEQQVMGALADYTAARWHVSRDEQDAFAVESHRRAIKARDGGAFDAEIVAVPARKGGEPHRCDEGPRADATLEKLAQLKPVFGAAGTATAGNASQISDGAAATIVVSERIARAADVPLKARIVASATSGTAPKDLFIAPVEAVRMVLAKAEMTIGEIDLVELNEAFAAQCLACMRPLELDAANVNVRGGAIALGHPIGASGARVMVTLLHALRDLGRRRGLAALCLGGGNAVAMIVEMVD